MPSPFARISLTIPEHLLKKLDTQARVLDRSRSRVIADAVRQYLARGADDVTGRRASLPAVSEPAAEAYAAAAIAESRRRRIETELALSAAERLERAEELLRLAPPSARCVPNQQIASFESYDDYYEWKRNRRRGG